MIDAVRRRLTPLRDRPVIYILAIVVALGVLSSAALWVRQSRQDKADFRRVQQEATRRTQQLQDVICGVYTPIANLADSDQLPRLTVVGETIIAATRHGALAIRCPGLKP